MIRFLALYPRAGSLCARKICGFWTVIFFTLLAAPETAHSFSWIENTSIVDVQVGSGLSDVAASMRNGGYELSDGTPVSFRSWYGSAWKNTELRFLTPLTDNFGIFWGFGTGERGEKYSIAPSLTIGFVARRALSRRSQLSFSVRVIAGGYLKEKACTADYGAIGGVQSVNCRMAASALQPAETLNYLVRLPPPDRIQVFLKYTFRF